MIVKKKASQYEAISVKPYVEKTITRSLEGNVFISTNIDNLITSGVSHMSKACLPSISVETFTGSILKAIEDNPLS